MGRHAIVGRMERIRSCLRCSCYLYVCHDEEIGRRNEVICLENGISVYCLENAPIGATEIKKTMNNLIQTITAYAEALEQKLSALEQRVSNLQLTVDNLQKENETLKAEMQQLSTVNYQPSTEQDESEVEIELVIDEEPELLDEPAEEPVEEEAVAESVPQEEILEPLEILEPIEVEEAPEVVPVEELVVEEPKVEPVMEQPVPQPEPAPKVEPTPRPVPTQTSLFGSAVEDIRQAISLGDRFLFQRELFAGNGELMQKTLDELNALGSLEEAMDYVADNFEWDSDSTAVQLFENVLKRRFA